MVEEEDGGPAMLTSGCLGLVGSEFQCRVRIFQGVLLAGSLPRELIFIHVSIVYVSGYRKLSFEEGARVLY